MKFLASLAAPTPLNSALRGFSREFWAVAFFSFVANILMLTPTIYIMQIFQHYLQSGNDITLLVVSAIAVGAFVIMAYAERMRTKVLASAGVRFDMDISERLYNASVRGALARNGSEAHEAYADINNLRQFITGMGLVALFDAPWIPVYAIAAAYLHPSLGITVVVFVLLMLWLVRWVQDFTSGDHEAQMEWNYREARMRENQLLNVEIIYALGMQGGLLKKWQSLQNKLLSISSKIHDRQDRVQGLVKFVQIAQASLISAIGAYLVVDGKLNAGAIIAVNMLVMRALFPVQMVVSTWRNSMTAYVSYNRLNKLLRDEISEPLESVATEKAFLELNNFKAYAPDRERVIFDGATIDFQPGSITVILGHSGCGKSTLIRSLLGVWPYVEGSCDLNGAPMCTLDKQRLGQDVGYLPQDIELFEGTIAENIARFGQVDADKVIAAARATGVHEMILGFKGGYDTPLGEVGRGLSGGQRQRIALARALYGGPKLIVLDEPNAHLDDVGDRALLQAMVDLRAQGATIIIVSHRLNVVGIANKLVLMSQGRIEKIGDPSEVMNYIQARQAHV